MPRRLSYIPAVMGDLNTAPAEAFALDPDRAGADSPDLMPEWLAYLIALVIVFLLEQFLVARQRHTRRTASRRVGRRALPQDSAQPSAAAIQSQSGHATARTRRRRGVTPECPDLSHVRTALLEKLRRSGVEPSVWSQLEALGIVPSPIVPDAAAPPTAPALAPPHVANIRHAPRRFAPDVPQQAVSRTPWRQIARAGTGPPTGPPAVSRHQSCYT
jgi:hypothetical protein